VQAMKIEIGEELEIDEYFKEPLLTESDTPNYAMFPIEHDDIWCMYKKSVALFWTPEEIEYARDISDFQNMSANEQHFVKMILAFFASSDGIVNENLAQNFCNEVKYDEAKCVYGLQIAIENIHSETYALHLDTLVNDEDEKAYLFNAIQTIPSIKRKADWALRWIDNGTFAERLVAFACVEGIHFSGAFCAIFWLKKRGLMNHGLGKSNEFISRDEGMHRDFACMLYRDHIIKKLSNKRVHDIVRDAVEYEIEFITESLPCALLGMNKELMADYIRFVADHLLISLGHPKLFLVKNPFDFMEMLSVESKTNFFESRVSEYVKFTGGKIDFDTEF